METQQQQSDASGFAEPSINTGGARFKRWRLSEDEPLPPIRILPAMKSLIEKQAYCDFWNQHFIVGHRPDDPTMKKYFPLLGLEESTWSYGQKTIVVEDPLVKLRQPYADRVARIRAAGKEQGKSKEEIKAATKTDDEFLKAHGYDGKWRFYGVDRDGNFGVLELNNTTKKNFLKEAEKFKNDKGYNPFSRAKGVFWVFRRSGKQFPITDTISVLTTPVVINNETLDRVETHELTDALAKAALAILPDFEEEKTRIRYDMDVLEQLAACGDDPKKITTILLAAKPQQNNRTPAAPDEDFESISPENLPQKPTLPSSQPPAATAAVQTKTEEPVPPPPAAIKTSAPEEEDEEAAMERQLAAVRAKKAAKAAGQAVLAATAAQAPAGTVDPTDSKVDLDTIFKSKKK